MMGRWSLSHLLACWANRSRCCRATKHWHPVGALYPRSSGCRRRAALRVLACRGTRRFSVRNVGDVMRAVKCRDTRHLGSWCKLAAVGRWSLSHLPTGWEAATIHPGNFQAVCPWKRAIRGGTRSFCSGCFLTCPRHRGSGSGGKEIPASFHRHLPTSKAITHWRCQRILCEGKVAGSESLLACAKPLVRHVLQNEVAASTQSCV